MLIRCPGAGLLRTLIAALAVFFLSAGALRAQPAIPDKQVIEDALVKIYTMVNMPDYYRPWQRELRRGTGSGCIIEGRRILTNAHVVADHTFIEVRKNGHPARYQARLLSVSHEADLALLTVDDPAFFEGVTPIPFGDLPAVQQEVFVFGFPTGGDTLSITKGIVSRIEHVVYAHSNLMFLGGQIDAAINAGNSGGPVIADGRLAGIAMQGRRDAENIGYLIPMPVIRHFLTDMEDDRYDGFPELGLITQPMENPGLRARFRMPEGSTGVLVNHILPFSPAADRLRPEDIVLAIDGHPVSNDGTVEFRRHERTSFGHYVDMHQIGDPLRLSVYREGKVMEVDLLLTKTAADLLLVPMDQYDVAPSYFIFGGIVFCPLSRNLISVWGNQWAARAPRDFLAELDNWPTEERRQVVVALQVLAAEVNRGYHELGNWVITEVNGKTFRDFQEFYRVVAESEGPYVEFRNKHEQRIVIDRQQALASHGAIMEMYRIPVDRSPDLGL